MSFIHLPNRGLFEEGVLLTCEYNKDIQSYLYGLYRIRDGKNIIPCLYKMILSYRNGFSRVIDLAGNLKYVSETDCLFDCELPFVQKFCCDFDEDGIALIGCLVDGYYIVKGKMNTDGEMFLKGYNE